MIEAALQNKTVDKILSGGLLGQLALFAAGKELGAPSRKPLEKKDSKGKTIWDYRERIKPLLEQYPDRFLTPVDLAYEGETGRVEYAVDAVPEEVKNTRAVFDIGERTMQQYCDIVEQASMVYWKGPLGAFDIQPIFGRGSEKVLQKVIGQKDLFSVMGGGDTGAMLQHFRIDADKIGYMSLAGGALINLLAGETLPGIAVLEESHAKFAPTLLC